MHSFLPVLTHDFLAIFGRLDPVWVGRMLLTLVLSGVVGLERSTHERASGLRTHILVGLGACLITMAGAYGFADIRAPGPGHDPFVLATYVVSGIGFLGAGAILRHGTTVRGLTTAASVWNVAGIGIAAGAGMGLLAGLTVGLILFVLVPLQRWESRLRIGSSTSDLVIHLHHDGKSVGRTLALLSSMGVGVRQATVFPGVGTSALLRVDLAVSPPQSEMPALVKQLLDSPDVSRVETKATARAKEAGPAGNGSSGRSFVRSRAEPARDLSRRKFKKPSVTPPADFSNWLEPEEEPEGEGTAATPAPLDEESLQGAGAEPGGQDTSNGSVRPRRPRPRV